MIGHAKTDGSLGRNYLLGHEGDRINATLAAAGHNLRLILNTLRHLVVRMPTGLLASAANLDTFQRRYTILKSIA